MAISYVGLASGTDSATVPTHQVGDLIVVFAFRDGGPSAPTIPGTFSSINSVSGTTCSASAGYRVATSNAETTGTWTNATSVICVVYRGVHREAPIGGSATSAAVNTTVTYNTLTMTNTDGTSWVVGAAGHRSTNTTIGATAPSGMSNRGEVNDATDEAGWHDTNGGVTAWSSTNSSVGGTSSGWCSITFEIKDAPAPNGLVQTTGWVSPGTVVDSGASWTSPSNAASLNSTYTTASPAGGAETSGLQAYNFGFTIPDQAIIRAIEVEVNARISSGTLDYGYGFINNADTFTPRQPAAFTIPALTGYYTYQSCVGPFSHGGGADTDNNNTYDRNWLPSDINNTFFGCQLVWAGSGTVSVDHIRMRIHYHNPIYRSMMGVGV